MDLTTAPLTLTRDAASCSPEGRAADASLAARWLNDASGSLAWM